MLLEVAACVWHHRSDASMACASARSNGSAPERLPANVCSGQRGERSRCAGGSHRGLRTRIGPLNLLGSTTCPPCVISARPVATSRRAAIRAGSINLDQSSAPTARAASDGHTEALVDRPSSSDSNEASSCRSMSLRPCLRQLSEHQRTESQSRAQTLRHVMVRPHRAQGLDGREERAMPPVCRRRRTHARLLRTRSRPPEPAENRKVSPTTARRAGLIDGHDGSCHVGTFRVDGTVHTAYRRCLAETTRIRITRLAAERHKTINETVRNAIRALRQDTMARDLADGLTEDETAWLDADAG